MILGNYPCCNGDLCISMPSKYGFAPEDCPHCGKRVWHEFSRLQPRSWTEEDFLKDYIVDDKTKSIKPRKEVDPAVKSMVDKMVSNIWEEYKDEFMATMMEGMSSPSEMSLISLLQEGDDLKVTKVNPFKEDKS